MVARYWVALERVLPFALLFFLLVQFALFLVGGGLESLIYSSDFMPTIAAAQQIREGGGSSIYDFDAQFEAQKHLIAPYSLLVPDQVLPFIHPPFEALAILPLMPLGYGAVALCWVLLLAIALGISLYLLQRTRPLQQPVLLFFVVCALSYLPVFVSLIVGQNSALVLLGICIVYAAMRREGTRWDALAGVGLVLVTLKLQVLPLILILMVMEGHWKALLWFAIVMAALVMASMPALGAMWPLSYLTALREVSEWGRNDLINPAFMHNWRGFATDTVGYFSASVANGLTIALTALSTVLFFYAWWQTKKATTRSGVAMDLLWALGLVTALLISPHLHLHDLMLLIFPGWLVVYIVQRGDLSPAMKPAIKTMWLSLLKLQYILMVAAFFFGGVSTIWVVLNVLILGLNTWLLSRDSWNRGTL